jgi:triphosphatase
VPGAERLVTDPGHAGAPPAGPDPLGLGEVARKGAPVVLDPRRPPAAAFAAVATECVEHWRTNEAALRASRAAPHLHQTRVGIRRLRSAFSVFRAAVPPAGRTVAHRLRALALPFGPARDLDVLLAGPLAETLDGRQRSRLLEDREDAYDTVLAVLHSPEWAVARSDLDAFLATTPTWPDAGDLTVLGPAALDRRARRVTRSARTLATMSPADRHRIRIEAKKLRYGSEFLASLFPADRPRYTLEDGAVLVGPLAYARLAEDVQSALGALNDHATADALLHRVGARAPEVDAEVLLGEGIAAVRRLAATDRFWD